MVGFSSRNGSSVGGERSVDGVVLAERMALPVLGQEDPSKIRMALEDDAEHVEALALHPVGSLIEAGQRGAARLARPQARAHRHHQRRVEVLDTAEDLEPLILPVDGGEPVEVPTAQLVADEARELLPALARQGDAQATVGHCVDPEPFLDTRARVGGRHAPPDSDVAERLPVFWNSSTWAWSLSSPYMRESGVGGHPGT